MDRIKRNPGLEAIFARLDEIHMSSADRLNARAALAQADALVDFILGAVDLAKRVLRTPWAVSPGYVSAKRSSTS